VTTWRAAAARFGAAAAMPLPGAFTHRHAPEAAAAMRSGELAARRLGGSAAKELGG